eukprot:c3366_g1_i1.p1 GENE.c3366_g1_i1~~c3366_g1_i1.p1  ORF type:complete len:352 (+),score=19.34 c3366_g1_i1:162-1217(+)
MSVLCSSSIPFSSVNNKTEMAPVFRTSSSVYDSEFETSSWASTPRNHSPGHSSPVPSMSASPALSSISGCSYVAEDHDLSFDLVASACEALGPWLTFNLTDFDVGPRTPFDASTEPKIAIAAYIERIRYYSQATPESTICGIVLMRRICKQNKIPMTNFNIHRLVITSIMVFAKFYDDDIDSNCRWARIAGIKKTEMNNLEIELLNRCQFDLRVSTQDFHDMVCELTDFARHPPEKQKHSPPPPCAPKRTKSHVKLFRSHEAVTHSEVERPKGLHRTKSIVSFFQPHHNPHIHFNRVASPGCPQLSVASEASTGLRRPISMQSLSGLISPASLFQKRSRSKGTNPEPVTAR